MPVWQNVQLRVQPTWLETQSVPRSDFGNIDALDLGAPIEQMRGRHAQEPLARAVGRDLFGGDFGSGERATLGEFLEERPGDIAHRGKLARAAMVDPVPELRGAHVELALGRADFGESADDFGARRAGEADWRAIQGSQGRRRSWAGF